MDVCRAQPSDSDTVWPAAFSIVDFKVQQSVTESGGQRKVQTAKVSDTAQPVSENTQNFAEFPFRSHRLFMRMVNGRELQQVFFLQSG